MKALYPLYWLIQWTWGFPQSLIGLIMSLMQGKCKRELYNGALITYHSGNWGGISLGMFIIMNGHRPPIWTKGARVHEYGHTIQSLILGPLYLFIIGIPSFLWANSKKHNVLRDNGQESYFDFYPEYWANSLGAKTTGEPAPDWEAQQKEKLEYRLREENSSLKQE